VTHRDAFVDYGVCELGLGGPDPHLKLAVAAMLETDDLEERAWRACCYVGPYEVSTGAVLWTHWPLRVVLAHPAEFSEWLRQNWKGLQFRRERRAARTPVKLADALISASHWVTTELFSIQKADYEKLWQSTNAGLRYYGRYALIKLTEALWRGGVVAARTVDIRPRGGWSPRETLSLLFPEDAEQLNGNDRLENIRVVLLRMEEARGWLSEAVGEPVSYFDVEVLLCQYRRALEGGGYPGRSHDTDLSYYGKVRGYWGAVPLPFFRRRRALFPAEVLGEIQGWLGAREGLADTYHEHGYFWDDRVYDFMKTADLARPTRRV
jgi:hypothetical protein